MAKILIPTPLRQYANKQDSVDLAGATVGEVLHSLTSQYAELRRHLYTDEGRLRSFVNVYVNDDDIRYLDKEATALKDGDTVSIVPSIAGGSAGIAAPPATLSKDEILDQRRRHPLSGQRSHGAQGWRHGFHCPQHRRRIGRNRCATRDALKGRDP